MLVEESLTNSKYNVGAEANGSFVENGVVAGGENAASTNFYWAQFKRTDIGETPNGNGAIQKLFKHLVDTQRLKLPELNAWSVDSPDKVNRKYPVQGDTKSHPMLDLPGVPLHPKITVGPDFKDPKTQKSVFNFVVDKTYDEMVAGIVNAVGVAGATATATLAFSFQSYVVETANKTPLGWVSWGYSITVDVAKKSLEVTTTAPAWHEGTDPAVWTAL